jgi:4-amino-4-deoxy-L-arabinose transferase-like glycosyltransferase
MPDKIRRWIALHPNWTLTLITLAALAPFLAKPFNIDDPLFIWVAKQIQLHPGNPYGFAVNWYDTAMPMWQVTQNPPLACYYLALAAALFGWSEVSLHFACLFPALAVILGTHRLARHFCNRPMLAALVTLFSPVFLISSTTVMCDVMMLAFWVWAAVFWLEGLERDDFGMLAFSGILIALAALTKYFGVCLIPLLLAYGVIKKRRLGWWAAGMLIPLAALAIYQVDTKILYGHGLLSDAGSYAKIVRGNIGSSESTNILTALTFTGGCLATAVFFAPLLWRKRTFLMLAASGILIAILILVKGVMLKEYKVFQNPNRCLLEIQIVFWAIGGICVLALAAGEMPARRGAHSWLLALWVLGTFLFVAFFNWTVNGRSILPMAPAVGILLARRLEQNTRAGWKLRPVNAAFCLGLGGLLALLTAQADFRRAVAVRQCARQVCAKYGTGGEKLWFEGHWGFQYYMEAGGGSLVDWEHSSMKNGDYLALPWNNTNLHPPKPEFVIKREVLVAPSPGIFTTMNAAAGSGFYWSAIGPLPFVFGSAPPEKVAIFSLNLRSLKTPN